MSNYYNENNDYSNQYNDNYEQPKKSKLPRLTILIFVFLLGAIIPMAYQIFADSNEDIHSSIGLVRPAITGDYPAEFQKVLDAWLHIDNRYVDDVDINQLVDGAIKGMLEAIDDPYTSYMTPDVADRFSHSINSSLEGIGAEVTMDGGRVKVVTPIRGAPAEQAGVLAGDFIISVDGEQLEGLSLMDAVLKIRGPKGSVARIEFLREGHKELIVKEITRDTIPLETVYGSMIDEQIALLEITNFSSKTADRVAEELEILKGEGMQSLILDLRNNPGGMLDIVTEIGSMFVPNEGIILQVETRNGEREVYHSTMQGDGLPVVVLIDKGSASASEILAAALQESAGMPVVGQPSFGKGSVQTTQKFSDSSEIKFTIARWLTPDGNWVEGEGVQPDYIVDLPVVFTTPRIPFDAVLEFDQNSQQVASLQVMLEHLGYEPGRSDGYFSSQTITALEQFQADNQLQVTGVVTGEVSQLLHEQVSASLEDSDTQLQKAVELLEGR